jgi:hypothetical protein
MATANESRFYASFKETRDKINALSSVLNVLSPPSEASRQLARQRLGDLKVDAVTYLEGNKSKTVLSKIIAAGEVWDTNVKNNAVMNSIVTRVNRYLDEAQVVLGLPEGTIPALTQEEAKKVAPIVEKAKEVKDQVKKEDASGTKISGGMIAMLGAAAVGAWMLLKRKK